MKGAEVLMKGRKTLLMLGLVAFAHEAMATAQVTGEQRFELGSIEMNLGVGVLNGQAREKVFRPDNGKKMSQLNWDMKQVPTLHLGLTYYPAQWLSLDLRGWTADTKGNSHMKDYDWLKDDHKSWSDYSDHPDTRVEKAWQAEIAGTAWLFRNEHAAIGATIGYQRSLYGWDSRGGRYTYSSDAGYRDMSGKFPDAEKGIGYEQTYDTPYVGLVGLLHFRDWSLEGRFKHSQWVRARDVDQHYLRDTTFTRHDGNSGRMQSFALALSYRFNPQLSMKAGVDHQVYAESRGSMAVEDRAEGQTDHYSGKVAGQSARTTLSTLAVSYAF